MKRLLPLIALAVSAASFGQQPQPQPGDDPIGRQLFPPELVMSHHEEIGLQDKQRSAIRAEVVKLQSRVIDLQFQLGDESEKMVALLRGTPIDEAKVLEQADKVMALEREIKRLHLSTLIRIKNTLTPEQIAKLQEIRKRAP